MVAARTAWTFALCLNNNVHLHIMISLQGLKTQQWRHKTATVLPADD